MVPNVHFAAKTLVEGIGKVKNVYEMEDEVAGVLLFPLPSKLFDSEFSSSTRVMTKSASKEEKTNK